MESPRFTKEIVDRLARRAGFQCSNPDCRAPTSGPQEGDEGAINVGEAAHIYGARRGSARYSEVLTAAGRSDVTNGIWLCRICHKKIDSDPKRYTSELLFKWRRDHEAAISRQVGKPGDHVRHEVNQKKYKEFLERSSLAYEIVVEKPSNWEQKLTVALLQEPMATLIREYADLSDGFVPLTCSHISPEEFEVWIAAKLDDLSNIIQALEKTINERLSVVTCGVDNSVDEWKVLRACDLVIQSCHKLLNWEEDLKSRKTVSEFNEVQNYLAGIAGRFIEKINYIPTRISQVLQDEKASGIIDINIVIDLPDGFSTDYPKIYNRAVERYQKSQKFENEEKGIVGGCLSFIIWFSLFLFLIVLLI